MIEDVSLMTTFGILSGPGALYGCSRLICRSICWVVTLGISQHGSGYSALSGTSDLVGGGGKNVLDNVSALSSFV
jgi:hypothetical protein